MSYPNDSPPSWISWVLQRVCKTQLQEEIEGDLLEFYQIWVEQHGPSKAKFLYVLHALKFLRFYFIKPLFPQFQNSQRMINHHFRLAWRGLFRRKGNSFVNVLGLSLGFASSLLIYLWCHQEMSTDRFHKDSDRLFSVYSRFIAPDGIVTIRNTPAKLPAELEELIPEVDYATGFAKSFRLSLQGVTAETFQKGNIILKMKGSRASPQFFNIFDFKVLEGRAENALKDRSAIAISRKMADIFFGSPAAAINQTIRYQNSENLAVALVFEDIGKESSLQFDYLTNWDAWVYGDEFKSSWDHFGTQTYIKLKEGADPIATEAKLQDFLAGYVDFDENQMGELGLQPFGDQYLYDNFENGRPAAGKIISVRIFLGIAGFILLIAIINFINLMTARASERAKEVGLRKTIGATRTTLANQFLTESMVTTLVSFIVGLLMAWALLPAMEIISQSELRFSFEDVNFILILLGVVLSVGLLSGSYPAWILSRLGLITSLRSRSGGTSSAGKLRKGLVVFQFSLSIFLTVATIALVSQMDFLLNKNLGFDRQKLLYVPIEGALVEEYRSFKEEAVKVPGVLHVDRSSQTPHQMGFSGPFLDWDGKEEENNAVFTPSSVGFDFVETMGLEIVAGRDFDQSRPVDENNFLVNETAAQAIGGEVLNRSASIFGKQGKIIGVVKDFHFNSLHSPIEPLVLDVKEGLNFGTITVRLAADNAEATLRQLDALHSKINPGYAFDYTFVENIYDDAYRTEQLVSSLVPYFAGLAIFISCLGLFGLVTFTLQKRVKEVGIRKVLGASFAQLLHLLSRDFAMLMIAAIVLSIPVSYYVMQDWLQGYAYSIELEWWIFVLATLLAGTISCVIIFAKVARAVVSNPVQSLRSE